jgi:hypothetical protein
MCETSSTTPRHLEDTMTELATRPETREQWLERAVLKLRPILDEVKDAFHEEDEADSRDLPAVRVSVGWPSRNGLGKKSKTIGQCWKSKVATDGLPQIFISPLLGGSVRGDVIEMLGVLLHELIHAWDDCESGHKGRFVRTIRAIGLEGKPTATTVGADLAERLNAVIEELGDYPHATLNPFEMEKQRPKQSTRMLKVVCPNDGYTARTTRKWLDELGAPRCPCGMELEEEV